MAASDRPRILISRAEVIPGERWDEYAECVAAAGGDPAPIDVATITTAAALPAHAGILITAGVDIDPARYGEPQSDRVAEVNAARDDAEAVLIEHALAAGVPLFCICRGFQLFNVVQGGSLLQHLEEREPHRARRGTDGESIDSGWHDVEVAPGSLLARVTGTETIHVNSRHHQAVLTSTVAPGLVASGTAAQDVAEAIEDPAMSWALGIQWHPERPEMADNPSLQRESTAIFEAFVAACATRAAQQQASSA